MSRCPVRLWATVGAAATAIAAVAAAQDMTGWIVTDPPPPATNSVATFTAGYENLGPVEADGVNVSVLIPIQPQTWPPGSAGFNQLIESTLGTDTNGNQVFWRFDTDALCNFYRLVLEDPNPSGGSFMIPNPFPAGHGGSFTWEMPVIPMEGINAGRVVITEPEGLRASYSVNGAQWAEYPWLHGHAGLHNLVAAAALCGDGGAGCVDLEACIGDRLWVIEPFEAELEIGQGNDGDPMLGCGTELVDFTAGRIAILRRGVCNFTVKFENAQNAGALGVILVNDGRCGDVPGADPDECTITMGGDPGVGYLIDIPSVLMSRRQGEELIAAIQGGQTVRATMGDVPAGHLDLFTWITSEADPDLTNDFLVARVLLGVFADGFESGDTSAWSATVP